MKKTGILSLQMVDNYGSLLQAYGLKRTVESIGSSAEFIDIKRIDKDNELFHYKPERYAGDSEGLTKLQKLFDKNVLLRIRNKIVFKSFHKICEKFRREELNIDGKSEIYDLAIIGSDEVFNCIQDTPWGYTSQLYGNIPEAKKVITYAASCGQTEYDDIPADIGNSIKEAFRNIIGFSVRDDNTYSFVRRFGIDGIDKNLDPALIYDFDKEIDEVELPELPEHYCIIYSYSNRFYKQDEINSILDFCKKHHLEPVALQGSQAWCKRYLVCTPFQCLKVFGNADFVITDTFHGTIFSAKYAERFAVFVRESNFNKLNDLIDTLKIRKHAVTDTVKLEELYYINKNKDEINSILEEERIRTIEYLRKYIDGEEQV